MISNNLTKALSTAKHEAFVEMTGIKDQSELLASIQKEKDLRESICHKPVPEINESFR